MAKQDPQAPLTRREALRRAYAAAQRDVETKWRQHHASIRKAYGGRRAGHDVQAVFPEGEPLTEEQEAMLAKREELAKAKAELWRLTKELAALDDEEGETETGDPK